MKTRPVGVTVVAVLAWIEGALQVLSGILLLFASGAVRTSGAHTALIVVAIVTIVIGIVIIVVANGLLNGSRTSRALITISTVLSLASAVYSIVQHQYVSGVLNALIAVVIVALLWSKRATEFFRN